VILAMRSPFNGGYDRELGPVSPELQERWGSFLASFDNLCRSKLVAMPAAGHWMVSMAQCLPGAADELAATLAANQPEAIEVWLRVKEDRSLYVGVFTKGKS
jgi:hypothetical protein